MAQRSASVRQASAGHSSKPSLVSDVMAYCSVPSTNSQRVINASAASIYCCSSVMRAGGGVQSPALTAASNASTLAAWPRVYDDALIRFRKTPFGGASVTSKWPS